MRKYIPPHNSEAWHRWFAWRPKYVTLGEVDGKSLGGMWVWWEWVEFKTAYVDHYDGTDRVLTYRLCEPEKLPSR